MAADYTLNTTVLDGGFQYEPPSGLEWIPVTPVIRGTSYIFDLGTLYVTSGTDPAFYGGGSGGGGGGGGGDSRPTNGILYPRGKC